jgi:hypothetical protein
MITILLLLSCSTPASPGLPEGSGKSVDAAATLPGVCFNTASLSASTPSAVPVSGEVATYSVVVTPQVDCGDLRVSDPSEVRLLVLDDGTATVDLTSAIAVTSGVILPGCSYLEGTVPGYSGFSATIDCGGALQATLTEVAGVEFNGLWSEE